MYYSIISIRECVCTLCVCVCVSHFAVNATNETRKELPYSVFIHSANGTNDKFAYSGSAFHFHLSPLSFMLGFFFFFCFTEKWKCGPTATKSPTKPQKLAYESVFGRFWCRVWLHSPSSIGNAYRKETKMYFIPPMPSVLETAIVMNSLEMEMRDFSTEALLVRY